MEKFRTKSKEVFASEFTWGLECGIMRYNERIPRNADSYPKEIHSEKYPGYLRRYDEYLDNRGFDEGMWHPYVQMSTGVTIQLNGGEYIVNDPDNKFNYVFGVYSKDEFLELHEKVNQ